MPSPNFEQQKTLAVGLGANLPSAVGSPISTLLTVRPKLEKLISDWVCASLGNNTAIGKISEGLKWRWSPLFETTAMGGPKNQPTYINSVLVVDGPSLWSLQPSEKPALNLLERFLKLENEFGRSRQGNDMYWGPRSLDIDFLGWGSLQMKHKNLILPHPHLMERDFVVVPLAAVLSKGRKEPRRIPSQINWPE